MSITRPNDKILYAPLKHTHERRRAEREDLAKARRLANDPRPEKRK